MTTDNKDIHKPTLLFIAFLQGVALLLLKLADRRGYWPDGELHWMIAFYTLALTGPVLLLLSLDRQRPRALAGLVGIFTLVAALLGYYLGMQERPGQTHGLGPTMFIYVLTIGIASFKALMYIQQYTGDKRISYSQLFHYSWRNFLTFGLSILFMLAFWGVLALWGALFKVINIDFFSELFESDWFLYPVLAMAFGLGVIIFHKLSGVIDTIARLQQALMLFLLPVLILIAVLFLFSLPFAGIEPLWATGKGSLMILWLQALILFFINGVYQDDPDVRPYPLFMHRFVYMGVALLPAYTAISGYGLYLRVEQYGWSISRCWAVTIWALLALFAIGYLWGIVKRRDQWINTLSTVNISMGIVVLALMLLVNSPLLDFRKVTVASQLARLQSGASDPLEIDYYYIYANLARPGFEALQDVSNNLATSHPELAGEISDMLAGNRVDQTISLEVIANNLIVWPDDSVIPPELLSGLRNFGVDRVIRPPAKRRYYLFRTDLDTDGVDEYIFLQTWENDSYGNARLLRLTNGLWRSTDMSEHGDWSQLDIIRSIEKGEIELEQPRWQDFLIGNLRFRVSPQ